MTLEESQMLNTLEDSNHSALLKRKAVIVSGLYSLFVTALFLVFIAGSSEADTVTAGTLTDHSIGHNGVVRTYKKYLPDGLPDTPVPLVFVLHGGGENADRTASTARASFQWQVLADRDKFIVVYPNGVDNQWHDCRSDAHSIIGQADDVGFIDTLITRLSTEHHIDPARVYATGASNGGMMSYRLAFEFSDRIAAIGAVIANLPVDPAGECTSPINPTTVVIMNGTADPLMPYGGGRVANSPARGTVRSASDTRDFWVNVNACNPTPVVENLPDLDPTDGSTVTKEIYSGCREGTHVVFFRVNGGGHTQPSIAHRIAGTRQNHDIESVHVIWEILKNTTLGSLERRG